MEIRRYIKAAFGGLIGGMIFALPWILVFAFSPIHLPFLAFLIGPGINKGYRLFKGRVNRKLPKIIVAVSIFILVLIYFLIFPLITGTLSSILSATYWKSMLRGTIISLIFAIVGIYKTVEDVLFEIGLRY